MISFTRIDADEMPWEKLSTFNGANIFHTRAWMDLLADFLGAEPVVAAVRSGDQVMGYFTGLIMKKFGLRLLGSPFRGWNTYFMGFNLMPGVSYREVLQAFPKFAFKELKCHFLMIVDANLTGGDLKGLSYHARPFKNFALDLTGSEAELFANMKGKSCRRHINRAIKKGVVIEETTDPAFSDEYYAQYRQVMENQSLAPLYGLDFVQQMIARLLPTGNLLLLRAKNREGVCIATSIDLVFNKVAVGWGAASWQQHQLLYPNELMTWYEMKRMKGMGVEVLQLADSKKEFKKKFGAYEIQGYRLMKAANPLLYYLIFAVVSIDERAKLWLRRKPEQKAAAILQED